MSRGVNKVILVGNLGQKPEIRYTKDSKPIASFSIATSESWKDRPQEIWWKRLSGIT